MVRAGMPKPNDRRQTYRKSVLNGKCKKGKPRTRWIEAIRGEAENRGISGTEYGNGHRTEHNGGKNNIQDSTSLTPNGKKGLGLSK